MLLNYLLVSLVAFLASLMTFFSGFGLGTLLLPAFIIFFPAQIAVAEVAVVHFANNISKLVLVARHADIQIVLRFGLTAMLAASAGAAVLCLLADLPSIASYELLGHRLNIQPIKLVLGLLMAGFAALELVGKGAEQTINRKYLPLGGLLSGFFGGLSGHQGAFRSMFLLKSGLTKEEFIGTSAVIGFLVDLARLVVYAPEMIKANLANQASLLGCAIFAAGAGAVIGNILVKKVTFRFVEVAASLLLGFVALALITGIL